MERWLYTEILWGLKAMRMDLSMIMLFWNLAGTSAAEFEVLAEHYVQHDHLAAKYKVHKSPPVCVMMGIDSYHRFVAPLLQTINCKKKKAYIQCRSLIYTSSKHEISHPLCDNHIYTSYHVIFPHSSDAWCSCGWTKESSLIPGNCNVTHS